MAIDKKLVIDRIATIKEDIKRLEAFKSITLEEFKRKPDNYAIADYHLRRASEAVLDIGRHIISKGKFSQPRDYTEIIDVLAENKIIPPDFAKEFRKIGGFRNRLVHMYWKVSFEELYQTIKNDLDKLAEFCKYVLNYVEKVKE